jgi:hypothetical protein
VTDFDAAGSAHRSRCTHWAAIAIFSNPDICGNCPGKVPASGYAIDVEISLVCTGYCIL